VVLLRRLVHAPCKIMEQDVFGRADVMASLDGVRLLRPDVTNNKHASRELLSRFAIPWPTYPALRSAQAVRKGVAGVSREKGERQANSCNSFANHSRGRATMLSSIWPLAMASSQSHPVDQPAFWQRLTGWWMGRHRERNPEKHWFNLLLLGLNSSGRLAFG